MDYDQINKTLYNNKNSKCEGYENKKIKIIIKIFLIGIARLKRQRNN